MLTVSVAVLLVPTPSVAVNWNVTVAGPEPESVSSAEHGVGALLIETARRGRDGVPTRLHAVTGVGSVSVAESVIVFVPPTPRLTVPLFATGGASPSATNAAAGGVIACVVPGWVMNPPVASTRGVVPGVPKGRAGVVSAV